MKKVLTLLALILTLGMVVQSCMEEVRQRPCLVGAEEPKSGDKIQVDPPSGDFEGLQKNDLIVRYQCGGQWIEETIGYIAVGNGCGGCEAHMRITNDCWRFENGSLWYGLGTEGLEEINANPNQFPETDAGRNGLDFKFMYPTTWYCGDVVQLAAHANVINTCAIECEGGEGRSESAWALGEDDEVFNDKNWAGYFHFYNNCNGFSVTKTLYAGQTIDVGDVTVTQVGSYLEVTVTTVGWLMNDIHMHITNDPENFPTTEKGNPDRGNFDYHVSPDYVSTYTFQVPLSQFPCGSTYYLALHATCLETSGGGTIPAGTVHNAWVFGGTNTFNSIGLGPNSWGWFFNYTIQCK